MPCVVILFNIQKKHADMQKFACLFAQNYLEFSSKKKEEKNALL
jgi:hypothetical protein